MLGGALRRMNQKSFGDWFKNSFLRFSCFIRVRSPCILHELALIPHFKTFDTFSIQNIIRKWKSTAPKGWRICNESSTSNLFYYYCYVLAFGRFLGAIGELGIASPSRRGFGFDFRLFPPFPSRGNFPLLDLSPAFSFWFSPQFWSLLPFLKQFTVFKGVPFYSLLSCHHFEGIFSFSTLYYIYLCLQYWTPFFGIANGRRWMKGSLTKQRQGNVSCPAPPWPWWKSWSIWRSTTTSYRRATAFEVRQWISSTPQQNCEGCCVDFNGIFQSWELGGQSVKKTPGNQLIASGYRIG